MGAGQSGKKTGAIIQARMQSTRLPGKILLPLPLIDGKPLLECIIDELKNCSEVDEIILATSINPDNDILQSLAEKNNIRLFRGSESDVLSRFVSIGKLYNLDTIVRLTADNPILDIQLLGNLIQHHHKERNDYTHSSHLPLGMNMEIVNTWVLNEYSLFNDLASEDREHVTLYIERSKKYKAEMKPLWPVSLTNKVRVTIDYPVDYALVCILYTISKAKYIVGMELISFVNSHFPWLWEVNLDSYQKVNYSSLNEELEAAIKILNKADLGKAAELLKSKLV